MISLSVSLCLTFSFFSFSFTPPPWTPVSRNGRNKRKKKGKKNGARKEWEVIKGGCQGETGPPVRVRWAGSSPGRRPGPQGDGLMPGWYQDAGGLGWARGFRVGLELPGWYQGGPGVRGAGIKKPGHMAPAGRWWDAPGIGLRGRAPARLPGSIPAHPGGAGRRTRPEVAWSGLPYRRRGGGEARRCSDEAPCAPRRTSIAARAR